MKGVLIIGLLVILMGCGEEVEKPSGGGTMGKVLFIIAQENFRDEELKEPKVTLEDKGYEIPAACYQ